MACKLCTHGHEGPAAMQSVRQANRCYLIESLGWTGLVTHLLLGSCSSCEWPQRHLARHVCTLKPFRRTSHQSPTSSGLWFDARAGRFDCMDGQVKQQRCSSACTCTRTCNGARKHVLSTCQCGYNMGWEGPMGVTLKHVPQPSPPTTPRLTGWAQKQRPGRSRSSSAGRAHAWM